MRAIFKLLTIVASIALINALAGSVAHFYDPYEQLLPGLFIRWLFVLVPVLILLSIAYKSQLEAFGNSVRGLATKKIILSVVILIAIEIAILLISFLIYQKNPSLYVVSSDIEQRYKTELDKENSEELDEINQVKNKVDYDLEVLNRIRRDLPNLMVSNDSVLRSNDNFLIFFERISSIPGGRQEFIIRIYSKQNLQPVTTIVTKHVNFESSILDAIEVKERKRKYIFDLLSNSQSHSTNYRLSFIHFVYYFVASQIETVSTIGAVLKLVSLWIAGLLAVITGLIITKFFRE